MTSEYYEACKRYHDAAETYHRDGRSAYRRAIMLLGVNLVVLVAHAGVSFWGSYVEAKAQAEPAEVEAAAE